MPYKPPVREDHVGRRKEEWLTSEERTKVAELVTRGQVSRSAAALRFGISPKTIRNILREVSATAPPARQHMIMSS